MILIGVLLQKSLFMHKTFSPNPNYYKLYSVFVINGENNDRIINVKDLKIGGECFGTQKISRLVVDYTGSLKV